LIYTREILLLEATGVVADLATHASTRLVRFSLTAPVLAFSLEGWLDGLPLRVSNEDLPRPRVARVQETI